MKNCKKCGCDKADAEFYATKGAICKQCVKTRASANRKENLDYYQSYDRKRYRESDERKAAAKKSSKSPAGVEARKRSFERMRDTQPEKYRARNAVSNALRDGRLEKAQGCFFCGAATKLQAHHYDYKKPLDVFWLCAPCHGKLHTANGDFLRNREMTQ
jgi:hypothetical protein